MPASGSVEVAHVIESSSTRILCVVRCLSGSVQPGDAVSAEPGQRGDVCEFEAHVESMWFPGEKKIDLLDPPHVAKVEILGSAVQSLAHCSRVYTYGNEVD